MIQVLGARILIQRIAEEPIKGSLIEVIHLADRPSQFAKVNAVGPGPRLKDGTRRALEVSSGDTIVTVQFCGTPVEIDGQEMFLVEEADILGTVEA